MSITSDSWIRRRAASQRTIEFSGTAPLPARIYANEGLAQVIFIAPDEVCETLHRDRGGKYQVGRA